MNCVGLSDSPIYNIILDNVSITTSKGVDKDPSCSNCNATAINQPAGASANPCTATPAPPPGPPPPPPGDCKLLKLLGCYNDQKRGSILPVFEPSTHDKTTHEVCAEACFRSRSRPGNHSVAGIDGGNHCCESLSSLLFDPVPQSWQDAQNPRFRLISDLPSALTFAADCGAASDLATKAAAASKVALPECSTMACRGGGEREKTDCGGQDRLIAYTFHCSSE